MKYNGDFKKLESLGYNKSVRGEYYFKSMKAKYYGFGLDLIDEVTTIFIDTSTGDITFEGSNEFKQDLLNEINESLKKEKW